MFTDYLNPEDELYYQNSVEIDNPPPVDETNPEVDAQEQFRKRFNGIERMPSWTEVDSRLMESGAKLDPTQKFEIFSRWARDFRDFNIFTGRYDEEKTKEFHRRVNPIISNLSVEAQYSGLTKEYEEDVKYIQEQFPKTGKLITEQPTEGGKVQTLFDEAKRGYVQSLVGDEAKTLTSIAEISDDAESIGITDAFNKILAGDKTTIEALKKFYADELKIQEPTPEQQAEFPATDATEAGQEQFQLTEKTDQINRKIGTLDFLTEDTKRGSNPLERMQRLSNIANRIAVGEEMAKFRIAAQSGSLMEKVETTVAASIPLFVQSVTQSADVLAAGLVGGIVGGPLLSAVAAGKESFDMDSAAEFSGMVQEEVNRRAQEKGIDISKRKNQLELAKEVFRDKEFIAKAVDQSQKHAAPVAALDAASAGIAVGPFVRALRKAGVGATQAALRGTAVAAGVEGGAGMVGEAAGQQFAYGKIEDVSGVLAEAVGAPVSVTSGAGQAAFNYFTDTKPEIPVQEKQPEVEQAAPVVEPVVEEEIPIDEFVGEVEEPSGPAVEEALVQEERLRQSPQGARLLSEQLTDLDIESDQITRFQDMLGDRETARRVYDRVKELGAEAFQLTETQENIPQAQRGKGMTVEERNRREQGGFIDLEAIAQGITEFATNTAVQLRNFSKWSQQVIEKFGEKVQPYLQGLWNAIKQTIDFFTVLPGRNYQMGSLSTPDLNVPGVEEVYEAGRTQRGVPESVMLKVQEELSNIGATGILTTLVEHIGDLSHRAQATNALINVSDKIGMIESFDRPGRLSFEEDLEQQLRGNAEYFFIQNDPDLFSLHESVGKPGGPTRMFDVYQQVRSKYKNEIDKKVSDIKKQIPEILKPYVDAHKKYNQPVTRLGKLGKIAAIELGELRFDDLKKTVKIIRAWLDDYNSLTTEEQRRDKWMEGFSPLKSRGERGSIINPFGSRPEKQVRDFLVDRLRKVEKSSTTKRDAPNAKKIRQLIQDTSTRFLQPDDQRKLISLVNNYINQKQGKEIGIPTAQVIQGVEELKSLADHAEFQYLKKHNASSLRGKQLSDFTSIQDVKAFLATTFDAAKIRRPIPVERRDALSGVRKGNKITEINEMRDRIPEYLKSEAYRSRPEFQRRQIKEALDVLGTTNLTQYDQKQLDDTLGLYTETILNDNPRGLDTIVIKKQAEIVRNKFLAASQGDPEKLFGSVPSKFISQIAKQQTIQESVVRMTRQAWDAWVSLSAPLMASFSKSIFLNNEGETKIRDAVTELLDNNPNPETSLRRVQVAAHLTQYRTNAKNPVDDLIDRYKGLVISNNTIRNSTDRLIKSQSEITDQAFSQIASGLPVVVDEEGGYSYDGTPEGWIENIESKLTEQEKRFLQKVRGLFAEQREEAKWVKEFQMGEQFEEWVNYFPTVARKTGVEKFDTENIDIEESAAKTRTQDGQPLDTEEGVLKDRRGIVEGQYYEMNAMTTAERAMKEQTYDIASWHQRAVVKKVFEDQYFKKLLGNERHTALYNSIKLLHAGHSGRGAVGRSIEGLVFDNVLDAVTLSMMTGAAGPLKQGAAPLIGSAVAFAVTGNLDILFRSISDHYQNFTETNRWLSRVSPETFHRFEHENPALDQLTSSDKLIRHIRALDARDFSQLKKREYFEKLIFSVGDLGQKALVKPLREIVRFFQQRWDSGSIRLVYRAEYIRQMIERGHIQNYEQFSYDLPINEEVAYIARANVENMFNSPSAVAWRGNAFTNPNFIAKIFKPLLTLKQTQIYGSIDRWNNIKAVANPKYRNGNSRAEQQFRKEQVAFFSAAVTQNFMFRAFGHIWAKAVVAGLLTPIVSSIFHNKKEGDEEKTKRRGKTIKPREEDYQEQLNKEITIKQRLNSLTSPAAVQDQMINMTETLFSYANIPFIGPIIRRSMLGLNVWATHDALDERIGLAQAEIAAMEKYGNKFRNEIDTLKLDVAYLQATKRRTEWMAGESDTGGYGFIEDVFGGVHRFTKNGLSAEGIAAMFFSMYSADFRNAYKTVQRAEQTVKQKDDKREAADEKRARIIEIRPRIREEAKLRMVQ